jgi:hypothetical protein
LRPPQASTISPGRARGERGRRPPKRIITDKLGSYAVTTRTVRPKTGHRQHKGLNNRVENSHVPVRKRERMRQGFRSWRGLQRFVSTFSAIRNRFVPPRSQRSPSRSTFIAEGDGGMETRHGHRALAPATPLRPLQVNVTSPFPPSWTIRIRVVADANRNKDADSSGRSARSIR